MLALVHAHSMVGFTSSPALHRTAAIQSVLFSKQHEAQSDIGFGCLLASSQVGFVVLHGGSRVQSSVPQHESPVHVSPLQKFSG
jgi:hypothetical protein